MERMYLRFFANDENFPFNIGYGAHESNEMYMHSHEDFSELVIVLDGSAVHVVGEERFNISKGDVFVVGKDVAHGYVCANNFKICNVMFDMDMILSDSYDIKKYQGFHSLFVIEPHFIRTEGFNNRLKLSIKDFEEIQSLIDETVTEYNSVEPGKNTMVLSIFLRLVVRLSRLYASTERVGDNKKIDGIAAAAAYMENNYTEDIEMDRLLELSHYSRRHFIRLFSDTYGVSPHKYLLRLRIRHATQLLMETNLTMSEIALRCGFNDSNYFGRVFKKYKSVSPNSYRTNGNKIS